MPDEYERVYTVGGYWDGPSSGVADFQGKPHAYDWESEDTCDRVFLLKLIDDETLALVLEDWEIWLRWLQAFDEKRAASDTHPALPEDQPRHKQIQPILDERLALDATTALRAVGHFRGNEEQWQVHWRVVTERQQEINDANSGCGV